MAVLKIEGLRAGIAGKEILRGVDLTLREGELGALMGPNGSGKSTLANVIMGNPRFEVSDGSITLDDIDVLSLPTHERARLGIFLAFQYPSEIAGLSVSSFLRRSAESFVPEGQRLDYVAMMSGVRDDMKCLSLDPSFLTRSLNDGFSGGEKKRSEILQLLTLKPRIAIFDEIDSGLDIDALKAVASGIQRLRGPRFGGLLITHYSRILDLVKPDRIHVMLDGRVAMSGGTEIVSSLENKGYEWAREAAYAR